MRRRSRAGEREPDGPFKVSLKGHSKTVQNLDLLSAHTLGLLCPLFSIPHFGTSVSTHEKPTSENTQDRDPCGDFSDTFLAAERTRLLYCYFPCGDFSDTVLAAERTKNQIK